MPANLFKFGTPEKERRFIKAKFEKRKLLNVEYVFSYSKYMFKYVRVFILHAHLTVDTWIDVNVVCASKPRPF